MTGIEIEVIENGTGAEVIPRKTTNIITGTTEDRTRGIVREKVTSTEIIAKIHSMNGQIKEMTTETGRVMHIAHIMMRNHMEIERMAEAAADGHLSVHLILANHVNILFFKDYDRQRQKI